MEIYIDGEWYPREAAKVSVFDHGLLYGDGVFEGIRSYSGRVFKLHEHVERLYASARSIWLEIPMPPAELARAVEDTLKANNLIDAYIRVVVTRGAGSLGLDPRKTTDPQVIIITDRIELYSVAHGVQPTPTGLCSVVLERSGGGLASAANQSTKCRLTLRCTRLGTSFDKVDTST